MEKYNIGIAVVIETTTQEKKIELLQNYTDQAKAGKAVKRR